MTKVKICGITDVETAKHAIQAGADALGFMFAHSKRRVTPEEAREIILAVPKKVMLVGVFVNETEAEIVRIAKFTGMNTIQLHGDESAEFCQKFSLPVIKAYSIESSEDVQRLRAYSTDYLLLDGPRGEYRGGNGIPFNWGRLKKSEFKHKKIILAGGLTCQNVIKAIQTVQPFMVDVSSGVETNGKKDKEKITEFIKKAKGKIDE